MNQEQLVSDLKRSDYPYPELDFTRKFLEHPWFGKLGRETFVALPGVLCARVAAGERVALLREWCYHLLETWGAWIEREGMIPQSTDGTLWYCHALAALWVLSLDKDEREAELFADFEHRFAHFLRAAIQSISEGRHRYLQKSETGLLELTQGGEIWMEPRRMGVLMEINALWFQARFLNFLWGGEDSHPNVEGLGKEILKLQGKDPGSEIFLHGLPLPPSFVLKDWQSMRAELGNLRCRFLTPKSSRSQNRSTRSVSALPFQRRPADSKITQVLARRWMKDIKDASGY